MKKKKKNNGVGEEKKRGNDWPAATERDEVMMCGEEEWRGGWAASQKQSGEENSV